jgi:hypothetical protein
MDKVIKLVEATCSLLMVLASVKSEHYITCMYVMLRTILIKAGGG